MKTLLILLLSTLGVCAAEPTLQSFNRLDFVVDTNSPPAAVTNVILINWNPLQFERAPDGSGVSITNIGITAAQALINPTVGVLPVRGSATNFEDSLVYQFFTSGYNMDIGRSAGSSAALNTSSYLYNFGQQAGMSQKLTNTSAVYNWGSFAGMSQVVTNGQKIFNLGYNAGYASKSDGAQAWFNIGDTAAYQQTNTAGNQVMNIGAQAGDFTDLEYVTNFLAIGHLAGKQSQITNSTDVLLIGNNIMNLAGSGFNHVAVIGSGGKVTNANDFVFGDSDYNYFFPGASARFDGPIIAANKVQFAPGSTNFITQTNATEINAYVQNQKSLRLFGTNWVDSMVPQTAVRTGSTAPVLATFGTGALRTLMFQNARDDEVEFSVQLNHGYVQGTEIQPHVHWTETAATGAGTNVVWELTYSWANVNAVFGGDTTISCTNAVTGTSWTHQLAELPGITGTSKNISSILVCRLRRLANSATADNYDQNCAFLGFDIHYQVDSIGSDAELTKTP